MNRIAPKRIISKQEAMCLLAKLELVECTESITGISINNSMPLKESSESKEDVRSVTRFPKRKWEDELLSMYQWFMKYEGKKRTQKDNKKGFLISLA